MKRSMKDEKGMAEALKDIGERLDAIERLLGAAVRMLEAIEASAGEWARWGKGPTDIYGNPVPYC